MRTVGTICITAPLDLIARVDREAAASKRSRSNYVAVLLAEALSRSAGKRAHRASRLSAPQTSQGVNT
ncbi:MAG: hypothetical protein ACREUL_18615 [Steroidobacteraceae bacterium]